MFNAPVLSEPDLPLFPDQSPEATQLVALVLFQLNVVESFWDTLAGLADKDSAGARAATVMLTVSVAVPPGPLQDKLNTLSEVSDDIVCEPDVTLLPDQSPEAVQPVVLLLFQLNVVEPLKGRLDALAVRLTDDADGPATVTLTESLALPPGPVQVKLYVLPVRRLLISVDPEGLLLPDQSPEAVQLLALLLAQLSCVEPL